MPKSSGTRRKATGPSLPTPPIPVAAAAVGAVCGLLAVGLVWGGERGCDAVRGRPSCGGYGVVMLVVIVGVMLLVGRYALRALDIDDAGLIAFFGVALPLIMIMALLMDSVFSPWMVLGVPLLGAACFAGASWLVPAMEGSRERPDMAVFAEHVSEDEETTPELPRYAPDEDTQPMAVSSQSPEDETTMLASSDEAEGIRSEDGEPLLGETGEVDETDSADDEPTEH